MNSRSTSRQVSPSGPAGPAMAARESSNRDRTAHDFAFSVANLVVALVLLGATAPAPAQQVEGDQETTTSSPAPPTSLNADPSDDNLNVSPEEIANMSRRERLELHRRLIRQRLEERREQQKQAEAQQFAAPQTDPGVDATARLAAEQQSEKDQNGAMEAAAEAGGTPPPSLDRVRTVLHTDPLDITLYEDERAAVAYILYNRGSQEFDGFTFSISYPIWAVKPAAVYLESLKKNVAGKPEVYIDEDIGILTYRVLLKNPEALKPKQPMLTVVWEGVRPVRSTPMRFLMEGDWKTSITLRGKDILGDPNDPTDGAIPANIQVRPLERRLAIASTRDGGFVSGRFGPDAMTGEIGLFLEADRQVVVEGQEFNVEAILNNPEKADFDSLAVCVGFDSEVLEVVDNDADNRIRLGINANDGASRDHMQFDHHRHNEADNSTGRLYYEVASTRPLNHADGLLFTITLRAKKPVDFTAIGLIHDPRKAADDGRGLDPTRITAFGRSLLVSDPLEEACVVRIIADPRPPEEREDQHEEQRVAAASARAAALAAEHEADVDTAVETLEVPHGEVILMESGPKEQTEKRRHH